MSMINGRANVNPVSVSWSFTWSGQINIWRQKVLNVWWQLRRQWHPESETSNRVIWQTDAQKASDTDWQEQNSRFCIHLTQNLQSSKQVLAQSLLPSRPSHCSKSIDFDCWQIEGFDQWHSVTSRDLVFNQ